MLSCLSLAHAAPQTTLPTGIWRSRGYGILLDVQPKAIRAWDITPISCLPREDAARLFGDVASVQIWRDGQTFTLRTRESITRYTYDKRPSLPAICTIKKAVDPSDPAWNFEVLWQEFEQDYAFFQRRGVDWDRQYAVYRPMVRANMSSRQLFDLFCEMLSPLGDRHVKLEGPHGLIFDSGFGPILQPIADAFNAQAQTRDFGAFWRSRLWPYHEATVRSYLGATLRMYGPNVAAGWLDRNIAYVFVASMYDFAKGGEAENLAAARNAFDKAFDYVHGADGLILDLRLNTGGYDSIALDLAGRFTTSMRPAFTKRARWRSGFTSPQQFEVMPTGRQRFTRPVIVLISNVTTSAAENLAMILKTFPEVILVGERTAGVHSDILPKRLPNGWTVTISNEVFTNSDGIVYEGTGIPPSVQVPYFTPATLSGTDRGMDTAIELLHSRK